MKKITLSAIIAFVITVSFIFLSSKYNNSIHDQSSNNVSPSRNMHLRSPNIDIAALKNDTSQQNGAPYFIASDVSKHSTLQDCYLIVNGNVYDVTSYIPYHPAGSFIIERYCGREVTGIFAQIHSNRAWDLLEKYRIGVISAHAYSAMPNVLSEIAKSLQAENPSAIVMKVSPKLNMYIAKVNFENKFYEVHINESGKIVKEEATADENWSMWEADTDDGS